jgi:hypothetical protein
MITEILDKIVDRLIQLTKERETRTRRYFLEHIESIFNDMDKIHADYLNTFARISEMLSSPSIDGSHWLRVLNEIRRAALPFQNIRDKVRVAVAVILQSDQDFKTNEAGQFFIACAYYFNVSLFQIADPKPFTAYFKLEKIASEAIFCPATGSNDAMAKEAILDLQQELRSAWNRITYSYAQAKDMYLK